MLDNSFSIADLNDVHIDGSKERTLYSSSFSLRIPRLAMETFSDKQPSIDPQLLSLPGDKTLEEAKLEVKNALLRYENIDITCIG